MARKYLTNIDLNGNQLLNVLLQLLGADPGSPAEGQIWYDSTNDVVKFRSGTATIILGRLDQISAPTAAVAMNSQKITGLADGTAATDAVNRGQLDAVSAGLDPKASVRVATTAAGTLTTSFANGQVVDGITLATGDRILIKNQASNIENGIYVVTAGTPTRATDADSAGDLSGGTFVFVEQGTTNADTGWVITTNGSITPGTTGNDWSKFTAAATGVQKFSTTTHASATSIAITHSLGTTAVVASVVVVSDGAEVYPDVVVTDANTVTFGFAVAPTANSLRFTVVG